MSTVLTYFNIIYVLLFCFAYGNAYVYRALIFNGAHTSGKLPARIVLLFDYHEANAVDREQASSLTRYLASRADRASLIVEDLHSTNVIGKKGFKQFLLHASGGGLMAGLASKVSACGGVVHNIEYRYGRVIGLTQQLTNPYRIPALCKPMRTITIADIRTEAEEIRDHIVHANLAHNQLEAICREMAQKGFDQLFRLTQPFIGHSLADACQQVPTGRERLRLTTQLLKADGSLLEGLLLLYLCMSVQDTVLVLAGGSHCAVVASCLLRLGCNLEHCLHDMQSMYSKKPPPLGGSFSFFCGIR